jgi:hypothetical protein
MIIYDIFFSKFSKVNFYTMEVKLKTDVYCLIWGSGNMWTI